ncbi:MAG: ATP-binding cassette domain-containing protein, partial [Bacteroidota bacterium]|nr:ATP-binding cassette domain-containing protein [Bacteroidota bacterium]
MNVVVEGLTKKYGDQKAIDNISFQASEGEILGFLGPNGAGKSTTMKVISCIISSDTGDVSVGNFSVRKNTENAKRNIGYLSENNSLYTDMNVIDFLSFSGLIQGVEKKHINDRVKEMISVCGLNTEKHKNINELSKGYRQRVGIAQAIIHNPPVLILDEPTTGLDPNQIVEIRQLIKDLGKEKTIIFSTHILS